MYEKKPYKIKLDSKSELLGMPKEKDWVLLANAVDRSQLRTFAASELGRSRTWSGARTTNGSKSC